MAGADSIRWSNQLLHLTQHKCGKCALRASSSCQAEAAEALQQPQ